ncbi:MAG TPA: helix-turn-helix domain-containing protein [Solirubrobacterales bacterium]|nr:helix-turn-helix domain-containing protein [Solirubrobacterales bacterium]
MHRVVALCLDGLVAFDLTAPAQAFSSAYRTLTAAERGKGRMGAEGGSALYEFSSCSVDGGEVQTTTGFAVKPQFGLSALETADTVVVPAYFDVFSSPPEAALAALRRAAGRGARVLSVCTGAFALAHAGLLDGRRATTHWAFAAELARRFQAVEVDASVLYVDEGAVMTSAGLSAGIDLCLHAIRKDFGAAVGERVARHMVSAPHRDGGQAQFIERPGPPEAGANSSLEETRRWAAERLDRPLDVAAMAGHAGVSPRTFARRFREETGATPLQWLLSQRVYEARRLLEETDLPIEAVAWRAGFGTAASLREHFRRVTETTPTAYRRSFRPIAA